MLYLHETIDIIGTGQQAYLESVVERARHSERAGISRLVGTWKVIGSTARWPRVVNLWEMDGWEHWAATLERQFLPERTDPALAPWWARVAEWRSGGFDRILEPASFSPTRADLEPGERRPGVYVQTITHCRPGQRKAYLREVDRVLRPILDERGIALVGAYRTPMRSDEALLLWAAPDFPSLCRLWAGRARDADLQRWASCARERQRSRIMCWLVPFSEIGRAP